MLDNVTFSKIAAADHADILELARRTQAFRSGEEDSERFRHFRLARGVYGQRQSDVQMFRTKIPFGKLTTRQLEVLAELADRYSNGKLHLTTRQNVQLHYVKLEDATKVWIGLAQNGMTGREACGNTVRNITASANAGIDPAEPFDVSPYVQAAFEYFLRNPICQDMGRKIKTAFSSSERDSAFTYFHDFGFIPKVKIVDGQEVRGFKVLVAGGLGAQAIEAQVAHEFLEEDLILPFKEACLRVFDRYGEREKRMKARLKFLVQKLGLEKFLALVEEERLALKHQKFQVDRSLVSEGAPSAKLTVRQLATLLTTQPAEPEKFRTWLKTNVFEQKQKGFFAVNLSVHLGNLTAEQARQLAHLAKNWAADDVRITVNQGLLLRFVRPETLPHLHNELSKIGLGEAGFNSTADVTACPGTDTCALGVTSSTGLATQLERLVREEYPHLLEEQFLKINISGCMNSCGQHVAASIGFHGSSLKRGELVVPAMQVLLGGGVDPSGKGFLAEKIIKLPTRRIPDAVRLLLDNYEANARKMSPVSTSSADRTDAVEYFNDYFRRQGNRYFYDLLKPFADLSTITDRELFDWGQNGEYVQSIGTGECAGVAFDVVGAIIGDAKKKVEAAEKLLSQRAFADAIYNAYVGFIIAAKASLLARDVRCNTHIGILEDFQKVVDGGGWYVPGGDFLGLVLQVNQAEPKADFAARYVAQAADFVEQVIENRQSQLVGDKLVLENYRA